MGKFGLKKLFNRRSSPPEPTAPSVPASSAPDTIDQAELPAPGGEVFPGPTAPSDPASYAMTTIDQAELPASGEEVVPEEPAPAIEPEATETDTKKKKSRFKIHKRIKQLFTSKHENIELLGFEVGEVSIPVPGVSQRDVNVTYMVNSPFQYVNISFNGEELIHHGIEPMLSDGELQYLKIIENAFEKMIHSEIVIIADKDREDYLRDRFSMIINIYRLDINDFLKEKLFYHLLKKYTGYSKIDILMKDPYLEDITCNGPNAPIYVNHRIYGSIQTDVVFEEVELNNFVMKIAQAAGKHISVLQPIRDATLSDGSRANLTLGREVTKKGSTFTIRRFKSNPVSSIDLIKYGTFDSQEMAYLWIILEYKRSILAAGGTASGKTTTLNALGAFISPEYKIVSIEDTAELNLMHPNWTQSITRTGFGGETGLNNASGGGAAGDIQLYDLLTAALRQRPEYIVVGEVRGAEAFTLFQAISVGHPCLGTIHAGSMKELLSRVESKPMNVPRSLFSSVDCVIFNSMIKVGEHYMRRATRIVEIVEIDPDRGDLITNPVYRWDPVTDTFVYSKNSALFAAISEEFGIDKAYLEKEMNDRAMLLESLAQNDITDYKSVANAIRTYSRDKDAIMERMG